MFRDFYGFRSFGKEQYWLCVCVCVCVCVELGTKEMGIAEDSLKLKNQKTKKETRG